MPRASSIRLVQWACAAVCGAAAIAGAQTNATGAGPIDDAWLGRIALHQLDQAAQVGAYEELAGRLESAMLARLACGRTDNLAALNDVVYAWRACRYLPMADDAAFAGWLLEHREITRLLFRAMSVTADPERALANLSELVAAEPQAVLDYPALAVAFATAHPLEHDPAQPEPATMLESFRWYADGGRKFRRDLKSLPLEWCHYLADTRLSLAERNWAMDTYGRLPDPARAYFDIEYDNEHWNTGVPKKIAALPYTLENLRRAGGICMDQAYFASEVCKALGIPAAAVKGQGSSGIGHAWLACMKPPVRGRAPEWDLQTGRYRAHLYYTGELLDPASGKLILDSQLSLIGVSAQWPLSRLELADAALTLAKLAEEHRDTAEADLQPLRDLAEAYDKQLAAEDGARKAVTAWMRPARVIGLAMTEELIGSALASNHALAPAWDFLLELRQADRMPHDHLDRFFDLLLDRTAREYPDYSCSLLLRFAPTIRQDDARERVYLRAVQYYGAQSDPQKRLPGLQGRLLVALGDDYRRRGLRDKAMQTYEQAAERGAKIAEVVLPAAAGAEGLLAEAGRGDQAIRMYTRLYEMQSREGVDSAFREQTARYRLGLRLADLLRGAGHAEQAERVLQEIGAS